MRLDKLMEEAKCGSRKQVKRLLVSRQVAIDEKVIVSGSYNVDPALQGVTVKGQVIDGQPHVYYMLNKPQGVVSAVSDQQHQTVIELIKPVDFRSGLFPVGRLDRDTEGLLLVTDNGKLAHQLLLPGKEVVKEYEVTVNGFLGEEDVLAFQQGIVFSGGIQCKSAKLRILEATATKSRGRVEITEGKFHQVKKMFLAVGVKVIHLKRLRMGSLTLDEHLKLGEYRPLNQEELVALQHFFNEGTG